MCRDTPAAEVASLADARRKRDKVEALMAEGCAAALAMSDDEFWGALRAVDERRSPATDI